MIGDRLLVAPKPGEPLTLGAFTVECRVCTCCSEPKPRYFVRDAWGQVVAGGRSFRRLAHFRRWQLDPMVALRRTSDGEPVVEDEPAGWPVAEMNAWQKLGWYLARNDMQLGDTAEPIARRHPDCVSEAAVEVPGGRPPADVPPFTVSGPAKHPRQSSPPQPTTAPVERTAPDDEGQFSLFP